MTAIPCLACRRLLPLPRSPLPLPNDQIVTAYSGAIAHAHFAPAETSFALSWYPSSAELDGLLWPLAHSAMTLLTAADLTRVKECPGAYDCDWLFYDTSKNGSPR